MITPNAIIVSNIKSKLESKGFKFSDAPMSEEYLTVLVDEIISAVKQATVTTIVTGTLTPPTAVAGSGIGTPETGTGLK